MPWSLQLCSVLCSPLTSSSSYLKLSSTSSGSAPGRCFISRLWLGDLLRSGSARQDSPVPPSSSRPISITPCSDPCAVLLQAHIPSRPLSSSWLIPSPVTSHPHPVTSVLVPLHPAPPCPIQPPSCLPPTPHHPILVPTIPSPIPPRPHPIPIPIPLYSHSTPIPPPFAPSHPNFAPFLTHFPHPVAQRYYSGMSWLTKAFTCGQSGAVRGRPGSAPPRPR